MEMVNCSASVLRVCRIVLVIVLAAIRAHSSDLRLSGQDTLEAHSLSVPLFHNAYHGDAQGPSTDSPFSPVRLTRTVPNAFTMT